MCIRDRLLKAVEGCRSNLTGRGGAQSFLMTGATLEGPRSLRPGGHAPPSVLRVAAWASRAPQ
eukprot:9368160-Alexandrium_andersonii.AAC.1